MSPSATSRRRIAHSAAKVMYMNAVYFPNSRIYAGHTPGQLNFSYINHVYYAYAGVAPDGSVFLSDEWADAQAPVDGVNGGLGSLMHLKQKHPHLQVVLSVGGPSYAEVFPIVASSAARRASFAQSVLGLIEASGLDGVDIAWTCPCDSQQGLDFLHLLAAVRTYMPEDQYFLTAALPVNGTVLRCIDLEASAGYLDFINLMAYDFFGSWSPQTGHHSQLYAMSKDEPSVSAGVSHLVSHGFPAEKILLGVPTHGRSFAAAAGPGQRFKASGNDDGAFDYKDLPRKHCKEVIDKKHIAAQCVGGDGGFVTYDNADTVKVKATYCKQKGLGGMFYSDATGDSKERSRSLIAAGFGTLHTS